MKVKNFKTHLREADGKPGKLGAAAALAGRAILQPTDLTIAGHTGGAEGIASAWDNLARSFSKAGKHEDYDRRYSDQRTTETHLRSHLAEYSRTINPTDRDNLLRTYFVPVINTLNESATAVMNTPGVNGAEAKKLLKPLTDKNIFIKQFSPKYHYCDVVYIKNPNSEKIFIAFVVRNNFVNQYINNIKTDNPRTKDIIQKLKTTPPNDYELKNGFMLIVGKKSINELVASIKANYQKVEELMMFLKSLFMKPENITEPKAVKPKPVTPEQPKATPEVKPEKVTPVKKVSGMASGFKPKTP